MDGARDTKAEWLTISDIGRIYGLSRSTVRYQAKHASPGPGPSEFQPRPKKQGPAADRYARSFVERVFGSFEGPLSSGAIDILAKHASTKGVVNLRTSGVQAGVLGLLASRSATMGPYLELVSEAVRRGDGLRIRCLSGTDFFDFSSAVHEAFKERRDRNVGRASVLLLHPFGEAAEVWRHAESGAQDASPIASDATQTFTFLKAEADALRIDPRWVDFTPSSLLVWTEKFAIVEAYDFGRESYTEVGRVARHAPLVVVQGGTRYHRLLLKGFDHVFKGDLVIVSNGQRAKPLDLEAMGAWFTRKRAGALGMKVAASKEGLRRRRTR